MGSAQLVTAMAAALTGKFNRPDSEFEDHLVIHDLYAPNGQDEDFARCIERLAQSLANFKSIHYVKPRDITALQQNRHSVTQQLGFDSVDEMYLGQNRVVLNRLLADAFPAAKKYCYGDSLGINFSADYFAPQKKFPRLHALRQVVKRFIRDRLFSLGSSSKPTSNLDVIFDDHCLVLANRFDQYVPHHVSVPAENFRDLYHRMGRQLDHSADWLVRLQRLAARPAEVAVLMTSNFSEAGKMAGKAELAAYGDLLKEESRPTLVVKPHPRDSHEKIHRLREVLSKQFREILVLDDPTSFYLPFESVFDLCFLSRQPVQGMPAVYCASSACLTFELLYGLPCCLGFGEQAVRKYFRPEWISHRLGHERDLQAVVSEIRGMRLVRAA